MMAASMVVIVFSMERQVFNGAPSLGACFVHANPSNLVELSED
jgi:hypothetical protein